MACSGSVDHQRRRQRVRAGFYRHSIGGGHVAVLVGVERRWRIKCAAFSAIADHDLRANIGHSVIRVRNIDLDGIGFRGPNGRGLARAGSDVDAVEKSIHFQGIGRGARRYFGSDVNFAICNRLSDEVAGCS